MFLYIFEDGGFKQTDKQPSIEELQSMAACGGYVITMVDGKFMAYNDEGDGLEEIAMLKPSDVGPTEDETSLD